VLLAAGGVGAAGPAEQIVVTAARAPVVASELIGNTTRLSGAALALQGHSHPAELSVAVPGAWIARGTEQESLPSIRSPVLTGPGSCGAFLMLEDGVPLRPSGFCNVNGLFESVTALADSIEVLRGPANALYGANGLHGTVHVLLPEPATASTQLRAVGGPHGYWRAEGQFAGAPGDVPLVAGLSVDRDGDFRANAGYEQAKGFAKFAHDTSAGRWQFGLAASWLDQETAGFISGFRAYEDESLRRSNANPEAYRDADSQRLQARFTPAAGSDWAGADLRLYLRRSSMDFLQHFLPGQPREENGQWSAGMLASQRRALDSGLVLTGGFDLEYADGYLREFQPEDVGIGAIPPGQHYDYDVASWQGAPFAQLEWPLTRALRLQVGLRAEYLRYEYDNRMLAGNTRDDGTPCTPAPCRFSRPADRSDDFWNLAPNLGLRYAISPQWSSYLLFARGFRPPQATELYRLQAQQSLADLDSETLDSAELGVAWQRDNARVALTAYTMTKRDVIFQDAARFNVSNGRTRHRGVELEAGTALESGLYGAFTGSWSKQTYAFDATSPGGEVIRDGNEVDTAPRTLASARLGYERGRALAEVEWVHVGDHYLDAANTAEYSGHNLVNLRGAWRLQPALTLTLRLNNLADKLYAERADFVTFPAPSYRYFPGRDRELYVELSWGRE
jgi:outer membrane receptor protein involved in Fe transport